MRVHDVRALVLVVTACSGDGGGETGASTSGTTSATGLPTTSSEPGTTGTTGEPTTSAAAMTTTTTTETTVEPTTGEPGCDVYVSALGSDTPTCGTEAEPCRTVTMGLTLAVPGCPVRVGPGMFDVDSGEVLPLQIGAGIQVIGAGHEPAGAPTILGDTTGTNTLVARQYDCPLGRGSLLKAPVVLAGEDVRLSDVIVVAPQVADEVALVIEEGSAQVERVRVEGGQEGVFIAGAGTQVLLKEMVVTKAGHAAIKPAGTAEVTVEDSVFFANKDAVEPICAAKTTVRASEAYCNGNGLEALDEAETTLIDNHVHHNNVGIGGRGQIKFVLRGNRVEHNQIGVLGWFGESDLGTAGDPGGNTMHDNVIANLLSIRVVTDTSAIGNTWQPGVDGADGQGAYQGAVQFDGPLCPAAALDQLDVPPPPSCTGREPVAVGPGFRNVAIEDGGCFGGMATPVGSVIVAQP